MRSSAHHLLLVLLFSLLTGPVFAAPDAPLPGAYGFDWLKPETAKCAPITKKLISSFRSCTYKTDGTFDSKDPAFSCQRNKGSEYLVYESKEACLRNFAIMEGNAP